MNLILRIKKGAVSNANFRAFEAALFLCIEAKIHKINKMIKYNSVNKIYEKIPKKAHSL